jgi:hypothetical protein
MIDPQNSKITSSANALTACNSRTGNLLSFLRSADISSSGHPQRISAFFSPQTRYLANDKIGFEEKK